MSGVIDEQGYRLNVGMVVANAEGRLLWARRRGKTHAWQFPQGGVNPGERLEEAMYRELEEELGLVDSDVKILAISRRFLSYRLPVAFRRKGPDSICIGQRQKWFLLRLVGGDDHVHLSHGTVTPEFDRWCWVNYDYPANHVISFKKRVYREALKEFRNVLFPKDVAR
ncbi:MAG: RNA pyrophosphohydrolase [Gammaproteobacteria bacterium RIFCSPHIGHO2_12_FULL_45_9]|nr:MAG: RNA pyrophosphohydrolase [Gammaproteobacteria bacterium RIFCSPHIGHO2_12_FULL_45_9]